MNVKVITNEKMHKAAFATGRIGSSIIRGKWLVEAWDEASEWNHGDPADAMIFQKAYWQHMMRSFEGKKILDLCDPDWLGGDLKLVETAELVDAITCSNPGLTETIQKIVKHIPVETVPDRLNLDYFTQKKSHKNKATRAVYFGFKHNADAVLPQVLPTLGALGMELLVISNRPFTAHVTYGTVIKNVTWTQDSAYNDILFADIALNPPLMQGNWRYKSNNKTLIAWALGLPVANDGDDLRRFLDPEERTKEAALRWEEVKKDWDIKLSIKQYQGILANIKRT